MFLLSIEMWSQAAKVVSLQKNEWVIDCNLEDASLSISTKDLGVVASEIQLNEETPSGIHRLTHVTAQINGERQLVIETASPRTGWVIDALPGKLTITTTDFHGVLTGRVASPAGRGIGILLDPQGEPVKWEGTDELVNGWGGPRTINQSYLPRRHPEVTHLGLGHVAGAGMHSLFDRQTDVAVDFGAEATLEVEDGVKNSYKLTLPVQDRAVIQVTPDYFTHVLGVPFYVPYDDSFSPTAPIVWSSWTGYYETVTEQDMVRNTDWLAANLKPYGFQYVVLDDGYDRLPDFNSQDIPDHADHDQSLGHAWITNWSRERFPHGPEWLTSHIHNKGLKAGLWMVPNSYGPALKQHPDWYLYDKQGKVFTDYSTPALDSTNPEVLGFLQHLFTRLDDMGFDYYKFDGEVALPQYAPPVDKSRMYSPSANFIESYRKRLGVIRETIGPKRFIEECPAGSPLNGIGYVNSYFNGQDLYSSWQGMYALFSSIGDNLFQNHYVNYVMPGEGLELGEPLTMAEAKAKRPAVALDVERSREDPPTGFGTTLAEARTVVTYVSLTGVAYPLASVMPELPEERLKLLKATMPTLPIMPIDLFSRGTDSSWDKFKHIDADTYIHHYPEVLDLKVNSAAGVYDVAAETNWRSETTERSLTFNQLGIDSEREYVVFDFWTQHPLGVFRNKIDLSIEPHDTRVLLIHPLANRPQLIANSRHISGSYSIVSQAWNGAAKVLQGESSTIAAEPYTLWFHLPAGYQRKSVQVTSTSGKPILAKWNEQGEFASLRFLGEEQPVKWRVEF
jgi:hypothetical protein